MSKAKEKLMNDSFEIKGIWYLPEKDMELNGVKGILKYTPERITLDLLGALEEEEGIVTLSSKRNKSNRIILGFSNYGEMLSLHGCFIVKSQSSFPGFDIVTYVVNHFFVGDQIIEDEDNEIFEDTCFSFTYLDAWMDIFVTERHMYTNSSKSELHIDLEQAIGQQKKISINSENILIYEQIGYSYQPSIDFYSDDTTKIVIRRFFRLSSIDKTFSSYNCFDKYLHMIRCILTLLIGSPLYFTYVELNLPNKTGSIHNEKCRLFFRQIGDINTAQKISRHNTQSVLFLQKHICDNFEIIFNNWFSYKEQLSEVINPYINDLYLPAYIYTKLLNVVRGLETYHRFFIENKEPQVQTNDEGTLFLHERELIISFIKENISAENQVSFIDKISYEDEKSLHKRLKEILSLTPKRLVEWLFGQLNSSAKSKLIRTIVQTRNYYTHRDSKEKYPLAISELVQLDSYIKRLNILLQFHVFKCLGINPLTIEARLIEFFNRFI